MASTARVQLAEHIEHEVLLEVCRMLVDSPLRLDPGFIEGPDVSFEDEELELFIDWDEVRGHGRGGYAQDAYECATRRIDLRGPTDQDPGPLEMEEADTFTEAMVISFDR